MILIKSKYITIILHTLIWGAVLVLPYFLSVPDDHFARLGTFQCNFFSLTNLLHIGLFYFNAFYLYTRFLNYRKWWIYVLLVVITIILLFQLKLLILYTWFPGMAAAKTALGFAFFPTVFFLVLSIIYRLVLDKMNQEKESARRDAEKLAIELKFLRSQVSPHFLFNVLNNLVSMARHKSDHLEPALMKLAGLMRYMLYESDEAKVSLETEIEYLKSYVELQKLRFEEDVSIISNINFAGSSLNIEPMLLIPLVENAFKHGITGIRDAFISTDLTVEGDILCFTVKNSFQEHNNPKDKDSGIGLDNLQSRLKLLYPGNHRLSIVKKAGIFSATLEITLR